MIPWHLPEDLKFFKRTTSGHPIVMGRKTYESIGKPLPKRQNIVLTRDKKWNAEGITVIHSPEDLSEIELQDNHVFIIGGAEIYQVFLPLLDELIITHVLEKYTGDTYFPEYESLFKNKVVLQEGTDFHINSHTM